MSLSFYDRYARASARHYATTLRYEDLSEAVVTK